MTLYHHARCVRCARCSRRIWMFGAPPKWPSWIFPEKLLPPWLSASDKPLPKAVIPHVAPPGHAQPPLLNVKFAMFHGLFLCPECRHKYPRKPK